MLRRSIFHFLLLTTTHNLLLITNPHLPNLFPVSLNTLPLKLIPSPLLPNLNQTPPLPPKPLILHRRLSLLIPLPLLHLRSPKQPKEIIRPNRTHENPNHFPVIISICHGLGVWKWETFRDDGLDGGGGA